MTLLAIESEITARLTSLLPAGTHVLTSQSYDDIDAGRLLSPAVYVLYDRGTVEEPDGYERLMLGQTWLTVACVRNVSSATGDGARVDCGALAGAVLAAIQAWQPASAEEPLMVFDQPPMQYRNGFLLFPLAFRTTIARDYSADL
jgi:hypothetical protein